MSVPLRLSGCGLELLKDGQRSRKERAIGVGTAWDNRRIQAGIALSGSKPYAHGNEFRVLDDVDPRRGL